MRVIYLAHALTAPTREGIEANRHRAAKWAAWAATTQNVSPVCSWITLTGVLPETPEMRKLGLEIDKAQVKLCDELWFVGGGVTSGMAIEASVAKKVVDLTHLGKWPPGYTPSMADTDPALVAEEGWRLRADVAMLRQALGELLAFPVTGPACQEHDEHVEECSGCLEQKTYRKRCCDIYDAADTAMATTDPAFA